MLISANLIMNQALQGSDGIACSLDDLPTYQWQESLMHGQVAYGLGAP